MKPLTSRRNFLKQSTTLIAAAGLAPQLIASPKSETPPTRNLVGSGIYGWGNFYHQVMNRNAYANLPEVFAAIRDCGYEYAEGFMDLKNPEKSAELADQMRAKGLKLVCIYTNAPLHTDNADETIAQVIASAKVCHKVGFNIIDLNPQPIGREKTDAELKKQVESLDKLGVELGKIGMRFGIHNHTPEMVNGHREFYANLRQTDPKRVGFCYDVHWVYRGGIPPLECLNEFGSRVTNWHLRQSRDGVWWETLDDGDVDYHAIAKFAREHHMTAPYTVELALEKGTKVTGDVIKDHKRSREYVRKVFGC
ncbi:MAG: sugar phosphate isomerase/epimerase family protein [Limisphaerales bacterium]